MFCAVCRNFYGNRAGKTGSSINKNSKQYKAAKKADPGWKVGKAIKPGALDGVTREDVERNMNISGRGIDVQV